MSKSKKPKEKPKEKKEFKVIDSNGIEHPKVFTDEAEAMEFAKAIGGRVK